MLEGTTRLSCKVALPTKANTDLLILFFLGGATNSGTSDPESVPDVETPRSLKDSFLLFSISTV